MIGIALLSAAFLAAPCAEDAVRDIIHTTDSASAGGLMLIQAEGVSSRRVQTLRLAIRECLFGSCSDAFPPSWEYQYGQTLDGPLVGPFPSGDVTAVLVAHGARLRVVNPTWTQVPCLASVSQTRLVVVALHDIRAGSDLSAAAASTRLVDDFGHVGVRLLLVLSYDTIVRHPKTRDNLLKRIRAALERALERSRLSDLHLSVLISRHMIRSDTLARNSPAILHVRDVARAAPPGSLRTQALSLAPEGEGR